MLRLLRGPVVRLEAMDHVDSLPVKLRYTEAVQEFLV